MNCNLKINTLRMLCNYIAFGAREENTREPFRFVRVFSCEYRAKNRFQKEGKICRGAGNGRKIQKSPCTPRTDRVTIIIVIFAYR